MKVIGTILAILVIAAIFVGLGYGAFSGCGFLSGQWGSLSGDWKATLIVVAALLISCTLFVTLSLQLSIKKYGLKGTGKVMAYNDFTQWYSAIKNDPSAAMEAEGFKAVANQMTLWGGKNVTRQVNLLYNLLLQDETGRDQVLKKADHVYIEIRRELGHRGTCGDNPIV